MKDPCSRGDQLIIGPQTPEGNYSCIRHTEDHKVQVGIVRPLEEGQVAEASETTISLAPTDQPNVYDIETDSSRSGPAKVNSEAFRSGWDRIFGGKQTVGQA